MKLTTRLCQHRACRCAFVPVTRWQRFCVDACRIAYHNRRRAYWIRKGKRTATN